VFIINDLSVQFFFFFLNLCALITFNKNNFLSLLQQHLFYDDMFTGTRAGQPVTDMRSQQLSATGSGSKNSIIFSIRKLINL